MSVTVNETQNFASSTEAPVDVLQDALNQAHATLILDSARQLVLYLSVTMIRMMTVVVVPQTT